MQEESGKFAVLFRKYRLKAEFSTLSELGLALSEKGLNYEESIFSHWQKGTRVPQSRHIILTLIELFIQRKALTTVAQANELLCAAHQGYLSEEEQNRLSLQSHTQIFQVPNEIANFCGRKEVIEKILDTDIAGKILLLHGPAGVGKTALAITLGHRLRDKFPDGVFWYKVEKDNLSDILLSISKLLGEDISSIHNIHVRSTIVRSILANKHALLVLDSAELSDDISLLLPNSPTCTTIITSQDQPNNVTSSYVLVPIRPFTDNEVTSLFRSVFGKTYHSVQQSVLLRTANLLGNVPLAVHIIAQQVSQNKLSIDQLSDLLRQERIFFHDMWNQDQRLIAAIDLSYQKLDNSAKSILLSASIFQGKDFALETIGYMNGVTPPMAKNALDRLVGLSLAEQSTKRRYRLHPSIREYVRRKLDYPKSLNRIHVATCIFLFFSLWWIYLQLFIESNTLQYHVFGNTYWILAFFGAVSGMQTARNWGGTKTLLGKSIYLFSAGLFMQTFGQLAYGYYIDILKVSVVYPSLGDIGYFGTIPFYTYGVFLLAKSSGIHITIRSFQNKIIAVIVPVCMVVIAYVLLLQNYQFDPKDPIKTFLDFGYPIGDTFYISIALVTFILSRNILDGIMRSKALFVLLALFFQFLADYILLYNPEAYTAGDTLDFINLISYFIMTIALLSLRSLQVKIKEA